MAKDTNAEGKKGGSGLLVAVLGALILAPLIVFSAAYFLSDAVKNAVNPVLSQLPGPLGAFFDSYPTADETSGQVQEISNYLLSIDTARAVDKLSLIRTEDQGLYDEVVKGMLRQNPNDAELLLEKLRAANLKKNILISTLDQIQQEKTTELQDRAKYLDSLTMIGALEEVRLILNENRDGVRKAAEILEYSGDERVAGYLQYLKPEDRSQILSNFSQEKADAIRSLMSNRENRRLELKNTAQILSTEDAEKLVQTLGNEDTYKLEDLAQIYSEMGPKKSGEVLAKVQDSALVFGVLNTIKDQQTLENGTDALTEDIQKALKVYKDFDDNIVELNTIFSKLDDQKISEILKRYFQNAASFKAYPLSNGNQIRISDEDIALAVLKKMSQKKVASILSFYDGNFSSEVSKKLTLPKTE